MNEQERRGKSILPFLLALAILKHSRCAYPVREDVRDMLRRILAVIFSYILLAVLLLPLLVTLLCGGFTATAPVQPEDPLAGSVTVFSSELEEYVVGVVAAEMPAAFPEEALKAQAVAARTYQLRKMQEVASQQVQYDVGQAYCSPARQKEKWGGNYTVYANKIRSAVSATQGEIMTYQDEPILAVFHGQSAGMTEASENVWQSPLPYLQSVDSSGDLLAPDNRTTVVLSQETVYEALSVYGNIGEKVDDFVVSIVSRTDAGYVQQINVGALLLTGAQIRTALNLRSTNFTVERRNTDFVFETRGHGHGAGMSQYGAAYLAEEGLDYHAILQHYYQGISFQSIA